MNCVLDDGVDEVQIGDVEKCISDPETVFGTKTSSRTFEHFKKGTGS